MPSSISGISNDPGFLTTSPSAAPIPKTGASPTLGVDRIDRRSSADLDVNNTADASAAGSSIGGGVGGTTLGETLIDRMRHP